MHRAAASALPLRIFHQPAIPSRLTHSHGLYKPSSKSTPFESHAPKQASAERHCWGVSVQQRVSVTETHVPEASKTRLRLWVADTEHYCKVQSATAGMSMKQPEMLEKSIQTDKFLNTRAGRGRRTPSSPSGLDAAPLRARYAGPFLACCLSTPAPTFVRS
eukprot:6172667-Pleurochrysis_carterae.AAC.5